ncbi:MAG: PilZ domain-containing protein [Terracidiphilus sp.]
MGTAELARIERGPGNGRDARGRDRRVNERFELNNAPGSLIYEGFSIPCEVVDISLSGCCVRTREAFTAGALAHVQVVVPILGMVLSIWGITQWTRREHLIGVRFIHPSTRSKNHLAALLTCLVDRSAADLVRAAVAGAVQSGTPIIVLDHPPAQPESGTPLPTAEKEKSQEPPAAPPPRKRPRLNGDHKAQDMEEGKYPAVVHILKDDSQLPGGIVDLSQAGCMVGMNQPFARGTRVRVEVEFQMRGLHFRLGGVTNAIHDKRTVEILFLDMSRRRQGDLTQVISELIGLENNRPKAPESDHG